MSLASPWHQFDPTSIGWLHRKAANNDYVTREELERIADANPQAFEDRVFSKYAQLELLGQLPQRPGRPPEGIMHKIKTMMAGILIDNWAEEIRAERGGRARKFVRGELAPREQAAEEVSRYMGFNITGAALRNKVSALKRC